MFLELCYSFIKIKYKELTQASRIHGVQGVPGVHGHCFDLGPFVERIVSPTCKRMVYSQVLVYVMSRYYSRFICSEQLLNLLKVTALVFICFVYIKTSFLVLQQTTPIKDKSRLMQNKDLVSCCLSYSANAKTAILQYLNCKSKVNIKRIILPMRKMFYASLGCCICLGLMFLPRVYLAGILQLQFQQSPQISLVCLFDVIVSIDGDLYALVCQKVELAQ